MTNNSIHMPRPVIIDCQPIHQIKGHRHYEAVGRGGQSFPSNFEVKNF